MMADDTFIPVSEEDFFTPITTEAAAPGMISQINEASPPVTVARPKPRSGETVQPAWERALGGYVGAMGEPFIRGYEGIQMAFPGKSPEAEKATFGKIQKDRAKRAEWRQYNEDTTAGDIGSFLGKATPNIVAGPNAIPQMVTSGFLGFLGGGSDKPTDFWKETAQAGVQGAADAAIAGGLGAATKFGSKGVSALRGKYAPEGVEPMQLNAAARRMGLPSPPIGQIDPTAPGYLRATPRQVQQQGQALEGRLANVREVPNPAGGTTQQVVPGGRLDQELRQSVRTLKGQADTMYQEVRDFAQANNLGNIPAEKTVGILKKMSDDLIKDPEKDLAVRLLDDYGGQDAFNWINRAGSSKAAAKSGMDIMEYHNARVAAGRALDKIERIPSAERNAEQRQAYDSLKNLKKALDEGAESWATKNAGNEEAMQLYNRAKDFYRDVAAPALTNPFGKKVAAQGKKAFAGPEYMYQAVTNPLNRSLVGRLEPTMSREGADMVNVLQNLPGMKQYVTRGAIPEATAQGGGPLKAVTNAMMSGARGVSRWEPTKRMYYAKSAPGLVVGPTVQFGGEPARDWINRRIKGKE